MPIAGIVTIIGALIIVAALAFYLIMVALSLRHTTFTLGTIVAGVRAIGLQSEQLDGVVGSLTRELASLHNDLAGLLASVPPRRLEPAGAPSGAYQPSVGSPAAAAAPPAATAPTAPRPAAAPRPQVPPPPG